MTGLTQLVILVRALRSNRSGVAAAEFALIAPVMLILLLGVYDIGNAIQQRLQLEQAVRAGAQYALSWPDQISGIKAAITAALPSSWNATVDANYCHSGTSPASSPASPSCPAATCSGSTTETLVTLCASTTSTAFLFPSVAGNSVTYVIRVQ
jgi:Flp pilus assembly protein TadG